MHVPERGSGPEGTLKVPWFVALIVAYAAVSLGLAAIGGWSGVVALAAFLLLVIAMVIGAAGRGRTPGGGEDVLTTAVDRDG
jgi:hypothetical protein